MADEQDGTSDEALAQVAFEAWRDYADGRRQWTDVTGREREAWEAAAGEVADAVRKTTRTTQRQSGMATDPPASGPPMTAMPPGGLTAELWAAAQHEQLNEALAALHRAAGAAGIPDAQPGSIAEVGALIAARWGELSRDLAYRTRRFDEIAKEYNRLCDMVEAGLATDAHHRTSRGGLPCCSCGWPVGGGRAQEEFIQHALAFRATPAADRVREVCRDKAFDTAGVKAVWLRDVLAALEGQHG